MHGPYISILTNKLLNTLHYKECSAIGISPPDQPTLQRQMLIILLSYMLSYNHLNCFSKKNRMLWWSG